MKHSQDFIIFGNIVLLSAWFGQIVAYQTKGYGEMVPGQFVFLPIGQKLDLFCSIDLKMAKTDNYSIEDLVFFKEDFIVDRSHIIQINETTIRLPLDNMQESVDVYYCYLQKNSSSESALTSPTSTSIPDGDLVGMTSVHVGPKPKEVERVECVSLNWQQLNCSWEEPKNDVPSQYNIAYSPNHRFEEHLPCPSMIDQVKNYCTWTLWSIPAYRKNLATLKITITGKNHYGMIERDFLFHQYEHVLLDSPKRMRTLKRNMTSVTIQWDIGHLQFFPVPIDYKIQYMDPTTDLTFHNVTCESKDLIRDKHYVSYTVTGSFPPSRTYGYSFRVLMKSSVASDKYWFSKNTKALLVDIQQDWTGGWD